jgi:hypothetical protein
VNARLKSGKMEKKKKKKKKNKKKGLRKAPQKIFQIELKQLV